MSEKPATIVVKPREGLKVRDPVSRMHIPETGIEVLATDTYWARRLRSGDVVLVQPAEPAKQLAAPAVSEE